MNELATRRETINDLRSFLGSEKAIAKIQQACPQHMKAERLIGQFMACVSANPKLAECDRLSIAGALMQCATVGLELGPTLGRAYLIPRMINQKLTCMFQIGYQGLADLAWRSGQIAALTAEPVVDGDSFEWELGTESFVKHRPTGELATEKNVVAAYAIVKTIHGGTMFRVLERPRLDELRARSASYNSRNGPSGPWLTDYAPMCQKTATIQALKLAPKNTEAGAMLAHVIDLDQRAEVGKEQPEIMDLGKAVIQDEPDREGEPQADRHDDRIEKCENPNCGSDYMGTHCPYCEGER